MIILCSFFCHCLQNFAKQQREIATFSRFLLDVVFGVVTVAGAFCYLGSECLPALSTMCLFGCLACVCAFVCFVLVCLDISLPFIQLLLFDQGTSVFYLPTSSQLFSSRSVLEHTESESSFTCNQNIKEDISPAFEVLVCFETKRNKTKHKLILHESIHATHE